MRRWIHKTGRRTVIWFRPDWSCRSAARHPWAGRIGDATKKPQGPVPAGPVETVPAYSTACRSSFFNGEFGTSAVGSTVTSCEFAEVVRSAYVNQSRRGGTVVVNAYSPVTNMVYRMTCRGNRVVACEGGTDALVYLY
jgi:hypothetical protein